MNDGSVQIATIGFTQSTAELFFERLLSANIKKLIDVRLHNTSQLAGFAKANDLAYLLRKLGNINYEHQPLLAPTEEMLTAYKKNKGDWRIYEDQFVSLMAERRIQDRLNPESLQDSCLLCSEAKPHHCHRRLVCEYLNRHWQGRLSVRHL